MKSSFTYVIGLWVIAAPALAQPGVQGLDPTKQLWQYTYQQWQKKQGLPQNSVHAILQTRDGYLWLGTEEGLARFDGVRFNVFNPRNTPAFSRKFITSVFEGTDGTLWIGTRGGVVSLRSGIWTRFPLYDVPVNAIYEDGKGRLLVGSRNGLHQLKDSLFVRVVTRGQSLYLTVNAIVEDSAGTLLVGAKEGLFALEGENLKEIRLAKGSRIPVMRMVRTRRGPVCVGTDGAGLFLISGERVSRFPGTTNLPSNSINALFEDRNGAVWVGTNRVGLHRVYEGRVSAVGKGSLSNEDIAAIMEDIEGNLWVGTVGNGLYRISNGSFTTFSTGSTPGQNMAWVVQSDRKGNLWAGNAAGEVLRWDGRAFVRFVAFPKKENQVRSILVDRKGSLWVGLNELYVYEKGTMRRPLPNTGPVNAIYEDRRKTIWIGTWNGLFSMGPSGVSRMTVENGLSGNLVRYLKEDREGGLWIGTAQGLNYLKDGTIKVLTVRDGLGSNNVAAIHVDADGVIWVGTIGGGLSRIKGGRVTTYTEKDGLYDENVYEILEDQKRNLWMSCNNGVFVINKSDLDNFADRTISRISSHQFGESDGMESSECNGGTQSPAGRTSDGRMWFATIKGVVMVDPENLRSNPVPPPVAIEELLVDREPVELKDEIVFSPGKKDFQFVYTALSFASSEKLRFRYLLEGFDREWIDAGTRRFALYNNIPPGTYTFRVTASNNDGVWNQEGRAIAFSLKPYFYETSLFYALCLLAAAASGGTALYFYRTYQRRKLMASELETQLAKAQLQTLRMQLHPHFLFNTLHTILVLVKEDPETARRMITKLSDLLRVSLKDLESNEISLEKELKLLKHYLEIEQFRFEDRLRVKMNIARDTMNAKLPPLLLQPLVENAVTHGIAKRAGPGTIEIRTRRVDGRLSIEVIDNGHGFDEGGNLGVGLKNTRARLERLYRNDFDFAIESTRGRGTLVRIVMPFKEQ